MRLADENEDVSTRGGAAAGCVGDKIALFVDDGYIGNFSRSVRKNVGKECTEAPLAAMGLKAAWQNCTQIS